MIEVDGALLTHRKTIEFFGPNETFWKHNDVNSLGDGTRMDYNYLLTYDSYGPVHNKFHRGKCITWASGGGGPGHSWALKWHPAKLTQILYRKGLPTCVKTCKEAEKQHIYCKKLLWFLCIVYSMGCWNNDSKKSVVIFTIFVPNVPQFAGYWTMKKQRKKTVHL
jgi:hypothetical protein